MKAHLMGLAAACMFLAATGASAGSTLGTSVAHAMLDVVITIPAIVRAEARADPASLRVTAEDVERGYVDVDGTSSVVLTSNARLGFLLAIAFDRALLNGVELRLAGRTVRATESGNALLVQSGPLLGQRIAVGYRLYLARGAQAGEYRWPLALTYLPASV